MGWVRLDWVGFGLVSLGLVRLGYIVFSKLWVILILKFKFYSSFSFYGEIFTMVLKHLWHLLFGREIANHLGYLLKNEKRSFEAQTFAIFRKLCNFHSTLQFSHNFAIFTHLCNFHTTFNFQKTLQFSHNFAIFRSLCNFNTTLQFYLNFHSLALVWVLF